MTPTPEQMLILEADTFRTTIVRGPAGSGKTTSASHRARKALAGVAAQRRLDDDGSPIRLLVLTFNRTLKGYVEEFIRDGASHFKNVDITINTFAGWAFSLAGHCQVVDDDVRERFIRRLWSEAAPRSVLPWKFIANEVAYVLGRFGRANLASYIGCSRAGRGSPSLTEAQRRAILDGVIAPYLDMLNERHLIDWNDCARLVLALGPNPRYDIVIADEVQDFGVQQVRAILTQMKPRSSITFVIDNGQSIYPHVMHWDETGVKLAESAIIELKNNYRNTSAIAEFVQPLLQGMPLTADGTVPDFRNCRNEEVGRAVELLDGRFSLQVAYAVGEILGFPADETVGILTMWGDKKGEIAKGLAAAGIVPVTITRERDWPQGSEVVALSTLHSAKGLEFDHVFILGFDNEFLDAYDKEPDAAAYLEQRRLLAMAITRAKKSVFIGFRSDHRSPILDLFDANRYILRNLSQGVAT